MQDYTTAYTVEQTPEQAFAAITDVRAWWSGNIEGVTDALDAEFTYRYQDVHYSKQRITELTPGKKVVWLVVDSYLQFVEDKKEWNGTEVAFDIAKKGNQTEVRFTHRGLNPDVECYDGCSSAWGFYINTSLRNLIESGKGQPNKKEKKSAKTPDRELVSQ